MNNLNQIQIDNKLTLEDYQSIVKLIDIAVKSKGLEVAGAAFLLQHKIKCTVEEMGKQAARIEENESQKEEIKTESEPTAQD